MKISIEVVSHDGKKYMPGTAIVTIEGLGVVAKLRSGEWHSVETREEFSTNHGEHE